MPSSHRVADALAAVALGARADVERVPLGVLRAHRRGTVGLGEAVDVRDVEAHPLHALDHRRRRRGAGDKTVHDVVDAGFFICRAR